MRGCVGVHSGLSHLPTLGPEFSCCDPRQEYFRIQGSGPRLAYSFTPTMVQDSRGLFASSIWFCVAGGGDAHHVARPRQA